MGVSTRTYGRAARRAPGRGVEWEFRSVSYDRELSRSAVTRLLVEHAESGGWELARTRIASDGTRSVVLRRKIIRQPRPVFLY